MSRHCFEATFSSSVRLARTLSGLPLSPNEVTFIYPEPESRAEYERIFNCPVRFGHKDNSMTLDMRMASAPVRMASPSLLAHFEQYARDFLAQMDRNDATTQAVTTIILAHLDDESLSIEKVAREMAVSVRTLQKRLEAEGVVFSNLLRDIRQQLAQKYLRETTRWNKSPTCWASRSRVFFANPSRSGRGSHQENIAKVHLQQADEDNYLSLVRSAMPAPMMRTD